LVFPLGRQCSEGVSCCGSGAFLKNGEYFILRGEAVLGLFGKNQVAVDSYFKYAATGGDQLGFDSETGLDLSRQTGGAGFVVSNLAVLDQDLHGHP